MDVVEQVKKSESLLENKTFKEALIHLLYQLADDDLVMGHRDSEWLGIAPDIEEDVAFSSIAQDEVGHATFFYDLLEQLGEGTRDHLAYGRKSIDRRNALIVERENGDWAYSICRHLFYDVFEELRLDALRTSSYEPLAFGATKIHREEYYHLLHHKAIFKALATPGTEARSRLAKAALQLWNDVGSLFDFGPYETALYEFGILTASADELKQRWFENVSEFFKQANLELPSNQLPVTSGREGHTESLDTLLSTMREVYELDEAASW